MSVRHAGLRHQQRGLSGGHLRSRRLLVWFVIGFGSIVALSAGASALAAPSAPAQCQPYRPCGSPPPRHRLIDAQVWRSSRYGFTIEYPGDQASIAEQGDAGLILQTKLPDGSTGAILIEAAPTGPGSPLQAIAVQLHSLQGVSQLAVDGNPADQLLGAGVGYRPGVGATYSGDFNAPQGVGQPASLAIEAATDGGLTVTGTVVAPSRDAGAQSYMYQLADQIINGVRWPLRG